MRNCLLTGSTGFVGKALLKRLVKDNFDVRAALTLGRPPHCLPSIVETVFVAPLSGSVVYAEALDGIDFVIHLAARAHVLKEKVADPLSEFRKVNTDGTLALARQAAKAGVKRFIFISSIGVNGNHNTHPFTAQDIPRPAEPYAVSKLEAEQGLQKLSIETDMEIVIIRPPLVYGPNAPGNFRRLVSWIHEGIPLPLGAIHNLRSLVAIDNLVDFILTCINHPTAANQVFLVADGEDMSTTDLLRRVGHAMGKPARLIPVPIEMLKLGASLLGKQAMVQRLCGSLQVDISKAREVLGWTPPVSVDEGLRRAVGGRERSERA